MGLRYSMALRNAGLDAKIAAVGPNPILKINDAGGAELVVIELPTPWMSKAQNGFAAKAGEWQGEAKAEGKPAVFRICDRAGLCHISGTVPGEMTVDAKQVFVDDGQGQLVTVEDFVIRTGNG